MSEKPIPSHQLENLSSVQGKEYEPAFTRMTVSGKGSSGNSAFSHGVATRYGIPSDNVYHGGKIMREILGVDDSAVGYIKRPFNLDRQIDRQIEVLLAQATRTPAIIEAKLGGVLNRHLEQQSRSLRVITQEPRVAVLKVASLEKRAQIAQSKPGNESISIEELIEKSLDRDKKDLAQWIRIHPWLAYYTDILGRDAKDNEGQPIYDLVVDSSESSLEEDLDIAHEFLLTNGLVSEVRRSSLGAQS